MSDLEQRQGRSKKKGPSAMLPNAGEPPGMERDSHGHAIPLKDRLPEDRAKARKTRHSRTKASKS